MNEKLVEFGSRISFYRKKHKLSQKSLAASIYISDTSLSRLEHGEGNIDIRLVARLSDVLQVPIVSLIGHMGFQSVEQSEDEQAFLSYLRILKDIEKDSIMNLMRSIVESRVELRNTNSQDKE